MHLRRVPTTKAPETAPVERAQPEVRRVPVHGAHDNQNPKRAPIPQRESSGGFVLTRPITLTVTIPATSTGTNTGKASSSTTSSTTSSDTTSSPTSSPSFESTSTPSTPISPSSSPIPTPSISVYNNGMSMDSPTSDTSPSPTGSASPIGALQTPVPGGAIAGIVIAATLIIAVAIVFAVRKRMKTNRRNRRLSAWGYPIRGGGLSNGTSSEDQNTAPSQQGFARRYDIDSTVMTEGLYTSTRPSISVMHKPSHSASSRSVMTPTTIFPATLPVPPKNKPQIPLPPIPIPTVPNSRPSTISTKRMTAAGGATIPLFPNPSTVISTFIPTLPDEMSIETGEIVRVLAEYDDGWALCSNALGERGMVPLECLDKGANRIGVATAMPSGNGAGQDISSLDVARSSRRTSSLGMPKQT